MTFLKSINISNINSVTDRYNLTNWETETENTPYGTHTILHTKWIWAYLHRFPTKLKCSKFATRISHYSEQAEKENFFETLHGNAYITFNSSTNVTGLAVACDFRFNFMEFNSY